MKKLLLILVFVAYSGYSQKFTTDFPEKVHWTIHNNVLYGDYENSEKPVFRTKVSEYIQPGTKEKIWFINYPDYNLIYTVRIVGNTVEVIKSRKV